MMGIFGIKEIGKHYHFFFLLFLFVVLVAEHLPALHYDQHRHSSASCLPLNNTLTTGTVLGDVEGGHWVMSRVLVLFTGPGGNGCKKDHQDLRQCVKSEVLFQPLPNSCVILCPCCLGQPRPNPCKPNQAGTPPNSMQINLILFFLTVYSF